MNNQESYPPLFRQQNTTTTETPQQIFKDPNQNIPTIDLNLIQTLNEKNNLKEACREWGVFRLVNHGVPSSLIEQLHELNQKLFSVSFEDKETLLFNGVEGVSYFWGTPALTPSGSVTDRRSGRVNWVEGFNVLVSKLDGGERGDVLVDCFRTLLNEYENHMGRVARTIYEAIIETLDMDSNIYNSHLSESTAIIRVYRYPKNNDNDEEATGMDVHTDSSIISILNQDQVGGLQVFKDNKWFHVKPIHNQLIVNLGDMMQAISNDKYLSGEHRVKADREMDRYSICYFVFPGDGVVIRSSNYKPFTYKDFQKQVQLDIKNLGSKVGLQRFRICY